MEDTTPKPTPPEAPESLHIDAYYKGFHVGLTKRDRTAKLKPYIDDAMEAINYLVEQGFQPSWNTEINNKNGTGGTKESSPVPKTACATCGEDATERSGVSKKSGKPYNAIFCNSGDQTHTVWK